MVSSNGCSWYIKRPPGVAETLQIGKHVIESQFDDSNNVLSNNPSGPEFFDKPAIFRPEVTVIVLTQLLSVDAEWLAGKSACNKSNWFTDVTSFQYGYVIKTGNAWPVLCQYLLAELVPLTKGNGSHAGPLGGQVKSSNAAKEGKNIHARIPAKKGVV